MTRAAGRVTGGASGAEPGGGIGRVEIRRLGGELGGARVDHRVARAQAEHQAGRPDLFRGRAGQLGQLAVAEARALDRGEQLGRGGVGRIGQPGAGGGHLGLERDVPPHLGEEPGGDPGRAADDRLGHAPAHQAEDPPQPAVGRLEELLEDDRGGGALGVARRFAGLATLVDPADRLVGVRIAAVDAGQVVERRPPRGVLGERPDPRLLEPAERLVERRAEGPVDRHHLAGRLHLAAERPVRARELVEREARQLDHHVVERGLEGGDGRAGDHVRDLRQPPPDRDLRRDPGDRIAGRLRGERRRSRDARVDLDHRVVGRVGRERELDVAAALDAERPDDRQRRAAQPLVDRVGQGLDRRDDDRVAGVDAERVDVLHRADRDARVVGVAHHLVLDLLPADEAALDHDLADRARPQAGPDALAIGGLGLDDPAAGAAQRERRPDDRRQADRRQCLVGRAVARRLRRALDDEAGRVRLAEPVEQVAERLAVLGHPDRLERRPEQPDGVPLEDAGLGHRGRQVERGLAAQPGEQALRALLRDDRLDGLDRERLEVDDVGDRRVGHDRGRVRVDQDRPDALGTQRAAGLGAGVVELGRLADDDRPRAEDQDRGRLLGRDGHRSTPRRAAAAATNRSKTASASSGPGAPSGWYWTVSIGSSRWRSPSTEPSLRLTWLTRKPGRGRQRLADDLDLVVLGGDLDEPELEVLDRVVRAVMPEPEARRLGAGGPPDDLVPEADPEQRAAVVDDRLRERDRPVEAGWIPGTRRQDERRRYRGRGRRPSRWCGAGSGPGRRVGASRGRCST